MRHFIIFVEGDTEERVLSAFLKKWLNPKLSEPVGIRIINFKGYANLYKDCSQRAKLHLNGPRKNDIIAVISLLDLHGPNFYPEDKITVDERYQWGKVHFERQVKSNKFKHHFVVHEIEAWLLSNPKIFSPQLAPLIEEFSGYPETVNFDRPPAKILDEIYVQKIRRTYKKVTEGNRLFSLLDPEIVYQKCPYFRLLVNDMLALARKHGG
jgi:hypothetical protein